MDGLHGGNGNDPTAALLCHVDCGELRAPVHSLEIHALDFAPALKCVVEDIAVMADRSIVYEYVDPTEFSRYAVHALAIGFMIRYVKDVRVGVAANTPNLRTRGLDIRLAIERTAPSRANSWAIADPIPCAAPRHDGYAAFEPHTLVSVPISRGSDVCPEAVCSEIVTIAVPATVMMPPTIMVRVIRSEYLLR